MKCSYRIELIVPFFSMITTSVYKTMSETLTTINGQDGASHLTWYRSKAPRSRNVYEWHEKVYHCAANHNKGWQLNLLLLVNLTVI